MQFHRLSPFQKTQKQPLLPFFNLSSSVSGKNDSNISSHSIQLLSSFKSNETDSQHALKLNLKYEPSEQNMMKINKRGNRYQRSSNNSHKKFICIAQKVLLKLLKKEQKLNFIKDFSTLKNIRAFYFIILAHVKFLLSPENQLYYAKTFFILMKNKIEYYQKEVQKASNKNFVNFRIDEIDDMQHALQAYPLYFQNRVQEAIAIVFKKHGVSIVKQGQYQKAIKSILFLQEQFKKERQVVQTIILQNQQHELSLQDSILSLNDMAFHEDIKQASMQIKDKSNLKQGQITFQKEKQLTKNLPLLYLQNSYPIYNHFFPIMFNESFLPLNFASIHECPFNDFYQSNHPSKEEGNKSLK